METAIIGINNEESHALRADSVINEYFLEAVQHLLGWAEELEFIIDFEYYLGRYIIRVGIEFNSINYMVLLFVFNSKIKQ